MRRISSRPWGLWATTRTDRLAETRNTQPVIASWLSRFARSARDVISAASTEKATAIATWKLSQQSHDVPCGRRLSSWCSGKTLLAHSAKAMPKVDAWETAAPMKT